MATVSVTQRHARKTMEQAKTANKLNTYSLKLLSFTYTYHVT